MVVLRLDRQSGTVEVVREVERPKDQPITAISGLIAKFIQEEVYDKSISKIRSPRFRSLE